MEQKQNLSQLIQYQPGSVVSKEIIKKNSGTVTLFAFDEDQGLSEHTAPYDALVMVIDGSVVITLAGIKHELEKGEMLIMPANIPHQLDALTPFKMVLTMIK